MPKVRDRNGDALAEVGSLREGFSHSQLGEHIQRSCAVDRHFRLTVRRCKSEYFIAVASAKHTNRIPGLLVLVAAFERGCEQFHGRVD